MSQDSTERVQAEDRLHRETVRTEALATIAQALANTRLDYQATLDIIAQRTAEWIGDACVISLLGEDRRTLRPAALYHPDPTALALLRRMELTAFQPIGTGLGTWRATLGRLGCIPVVAPDQTRVLRASGYGPYLDRFGCHSLLVVPLQAGGRLLGTLAVTRDRAGRSYTIDDEVFLQQLADRAALAIDNAQLYRTAQEAIRRKDESLALFELLLVAAPVGFAVLDQHLRYIRVNAALAALYGRTPADLQGRPLHAALPERAAALEQLYRQVLTTGEPILNREVSSAGSTAGGPPRYWLESYYPIRLQQGPPLGVGVTVVEITERVQIEEARRAQTAAEQANQAKSEFLSRMSHELRTPLNAILGFAQLLELGDPSPPQRESITYILRGGRHLLGLINEVLDIARIEAGHLALSPEPVSVQDLLYESLDLIRPLAVQRQIQLQLGPLPPPQQHLAADRQRIKQVLLNLLANAIKYNHVGGGVVLTAAEHPAGQMRITVQDTGPGIPADKLTRLFTPFDRLGAEQSSVEGTGLGLALARHLVEAMGGTLGVESTVGQGSRFAITLPLVEGPLERLQREGFAPAVPLPVGGPVHTLLYIEDNLSNLALVEHLLAREAQFKIVPALQGRLGLDLAREHQPDLILLDLHLPDLSGAEVLRQLQADPRTRAIPVVIISADASPRQIDRLLVAGARAYLTKPLDVQQFLAVVQDALQGVAPPFLTWVPDHQSGDVH